MKQRQRHANIVDIIRNFDGVTAEMLAEYASVTPRTIYRDVAALRASGVPIVGLPGSGYSFDERAAVVAGLSTTQVQALLDAAALGIIVARAQAPATLDITTTAAAIGRIVEALPVAVRDGLIREAA